MEQLKAVFQQIVDLPDAEWSRLSPQVKKRTLEKGEFVVKEGVVCREVYFVKSGCLRMYYIHQGNEHIRQFFFENSFTTDMESFISQKPSYMFIEALEPCQLLILTKHEIDRLYRSSHSFERLGRIVAEQNFLGLANRMANLFLRTPEQLYEDLLHRNSKILQRIPQYMVASYLGVTPEGLSRIRKRISTKGRS